MYDARHRINMEAVCFACRDSLGEAKSRQASKDSYIPIINPHSAFACLGVAEPRREGKR